MGDYDDVSRVVWVLGAGFSRSLDGPLLKDFFTESLNVATEQSDSGLAGKTRELKALYGLDKKEERRASALGS